MTFILTPGRRRPLAGNSVAEVAQLPAGSRGGASGRGDGSERSFRATAVFLFFFNVLVYDGVDSRLLCLRRLALPKPIVTCSPELPERWFALPGQF